MKDDQLSRAMAAVKRLEEVIGGATQGDMTDEDIDVALATIRPGELLAAEISDGDRVRLVDLAERIRMSYATVHAWASRGVDDGRGGRVVLATKRIGRAWLTSSGAYRRFIAALPDGGPQTGAVTKAKAKSGKRRTT